MQPNPNPDPNPSWEAAPPRVPVGLKEETIGWTERPATTDQRATACARATLQGCTLINEKVVRMQHKNYKVGVVRT